jgi:hypothetical protein
MTPSDDVHAKRGSNSVVPHPHHELLAEAEREREAVNSREGKALLDAVVKAVGAYSDFLDRQGLIWDHDLDPDNLPRMKATALVVTVDYGKAEQMDIVLRDGAIDRVYGNGTNPDFEGRGPPDIPHKPRNDD